MKLKETEVISEVRCNVCGAKIEPDDLGYYPDFLHIEKKWNYFSAKDGKEQNVDICEECWDKIVKTFAINAE